MNCRFHPRQSIHQNQLSLVDVTMGKWFPRNVHLTRWAFIGLITFVECVSQSAQRVIGRFNLLPAIANSSIASDSNCPSSFDFTSIKSYRAINPANTSGIYDGIQWEDLLVNDNACISSSYYTTATYFEPATPSDLSTNGVGSQPWFLLGWDNSGLQCPPYKTDRPNQYFFTDDLPGFRDYLESNNFLPTTGVEEAYREDIYLFTIGTYSSDVKAENACVFLKELTDDQNEDDPDPDSSPSSDPACLSAVTHVMMAGGSTKPMSSLMLGDEVKRARSSSVDGIADTVLTFSHRDALTWTSFISLTIRIEGGLHDSTNSSNQQRGLMSNVTIELTADHLVPVLGGTVLRAAELREGDRLVVLPRAHHSSRATISQITQVRSQGMYAPVTMSGYIVLEGGVVVSCYTNAVGEVTSHALLAPVRALFVMGLGVDWCPFVDICRNLLFPPRVHNSFVPTQPSLPVHQFSFGAELILNGLVSLQV